MKKIFFYLILTSLSTTLAIAQLQKGNVLLGGGFGISNTKSKSADSNISSTVINGSINPRVGLFLNNHSVVGLETGYSFLRGKNSNPDIIYLYKRTYSSISLRPFYRQYFSVGEKVALYIHGKAGVSLGSRKEKDQQMDSTGVYQPIQQKTNMISAGVSVSPGIAFFLTPKFSIEAMISILSYEYTKYKPSEGSDYSNTNFNFMLNTFELGIAWYLSKKS